MSSAKLASWSVVSGFGLPNDAHDEARVDGGGFLNARIVAEAKGKEL